MQPLIPWFEIPVFELGPLELHGFGILVALGFVLGGNAAMRRADRLGLESEAINRLITWLVVGTFVGGHIGYGLMYKPEEYLNDPVQFLYFWQGLSSVGGFLVCVPLAIWFFSREKLPVLKYTDCLAYGLALGWFLGRMGCFVAHDHMGAETDFFLGVWCRPEAGHMIDLPNWMVHGSGEPNLPFALCAEKPSVHAVHDTGLYEALWSLGMFGLFTLMDRRAWHPGTFTLLLGLVYGPVRFVLDTLRPESTDPLRAGLTPAQWVVILFSLTCLGALIYLRVQTKQEPYGPPAPREKKTAA